MKLYLAGLYASNFDLHGRIFNTLPEVEQQHRLGVRYVLESYHYVFRDSYVKKIRRDGAKVFLDSGAFSAFTLGKKVDLKKYCRYIKENEDIIECASVLDSIGSAQGTYANQVAMEKEGVCPLPCFHYGEDPRYLEYYIANYEYITLGGMVPISNQQLYYWLDELWEKYLSDGSGRPRLKVHGFGLTAEKLVMRYPWYSVDSSAWVQLAANGILRHPDYGMIPISSSSPSRRKHDHHFDTLPEIQQKVLEESFTKPGFTIERLRDDYKARWTFNCWAYNTMNDRYAEAAKPFMREQPGLF